MATTRIGLLLGDPAGVGPEIIAKVLDQFGDTPGVHFSVIGTAETLAAGADVARVGLPASLATRGLSVSADAHRLIGIDTSGIGRIKRGESSSAAGLFALRSMQAAVAAVQAGRIEAIVYAPLNKHAMKLAGFAEVDELHYLANLFGSHGFCSELNQLDDLWTARVTSHVPLRDVAALITRERVCDATRLAVATMRQAGIEQPRIVIVGLNPHAGDSGTIGTEDIDVIAPAVAQLRAEGLDAQGPVSPDTAFVTARRGGAKLIVTMYHDQGQIALKSMAFERVLTILGGLPVPAITASAGSAYDIAGRNLANPEALIRACGLARRMAETRRASAAAPVAPTS
ncbi:MAG: 4-hydroxythreonine-4-phosphate dehydrogenase PdxA [Alphaproteobacteria bacterium]|nr:4-hydroxythreonine-4-phosphate dehydrogenase PdxA [Alphaproteobacteria bacterium]